MKHSLTRSNTVIASSTEVSPAAPLTIAGLDMSWGRGAVVFAAGSVMTFCSFAYASQSLLASLGTLQFISNVVFARYILQEKLSARVLLATALIVLGVVVTVCFSDHSSEVYTVQDLLRLYDEDYVFFLEMLGLLLLVLLCTYTVYTLRERNKRPLPFTPVVRPVSFACVAATIGTQSVLQSKCIAEVIKSSSRGDAQQSQWFLAVISAVFVCGLLVWLVCLHEALKLFDGAVIIPLLQVCWTLAAIAQGGVYFREFRAFSSRQCAGFATGLAIVVVGVAVLTYRSAADTAGEDADELDSKRRWRAAGSAGGEEEGEALTQVTSSSDDSLYDRDNDHRNLDRDNDHRNLDRNDNKIDTLEATLQHQQQQRQELDNSTAHSPLLPASASSSSSSPV